MDHSTGSWWLYLLDTVSLQWARYWTPRVSDSAAVPPLWHLSSTIACVCAFVWKKLISLRWIIMYYKCIKLFKKLVYRNFFFLKPYFREVNKLWEALIIICWFLICSFYAPVTTESEVTPHLIHLDKGLVLLAWNNSLSSGKMIWKIGWECLFNSMHCSSNYNLNGCKPLVRVHKGEVNGSALDLLFLELWISFDFLYWLNNLFQFLFFVQNWFSNKKLQRRRNLQSLAPI